MNKNQFSRFEERIQALVEGGFARLFAGRLHPREVALRLAHVMEDDAQPDADGILAAPNRYLVHLHPEDYRALLVAQPDLAAILAEHLVGLARESGLRLDEPPDVVLIPDEGGLLHTVQVRAEHVREAAQSTQVMETLPTDPGGARAQSSRLPAAFLVLDGNRYVPLDRTVINIGRRHDNTIVLDNPRVSRQHCQLRFRFGQFILFDLGSRAGTLVNNARVSECVLRPGDVIALSGTQMVYVVEEATTGQASPVSDTQVGRKPDDTEKDESR